jgi:hypothetical protein
MAQWPGPSPEEIYVPPRLDAPSPPPRDRLEAGFFTAEEEADTYGDMERVERARHVLADAGDAFCELEVCWHEGRRAVRVWLTAERERYEPRLVEALGPDRVVVERARRSARQVEALHARVRAEAAALAEEGIYLSSTGPRRDRLELAYWAADPAGAERILHERYGDFATFAYLGAARRGLRPQPFGSWLAEASRLHVFYGLGRNGERPGTCTAAESDDGVIVQLSILDWLGAKTLIGGFTPAHATVELPAPLGDRPVIDNADNRARPHWTQVTASR